MKVSKLLVLGTILVALYMTGSALGQCVPKISIGPVGHFDVDDTFAILARPGDVIYYVVTAELSSGDCPITNGEPELEIPDGSIEDLDNGLVLASGTQKVYTALVMYTVDPADQGNLGAPANAVRSQARINATAHVGTISLPVTGTGTWDIFVINPDTAVTIDSDVDYVSALGTDVTLTITEENMGDVDLTNPYIEVFVDGVSIGTFDETSSPEFQSGDDGDGVLEPGTPGETWEWEIVVQDVDADTTFVVIGHGTDPLGDDVTWCDPAVIVPDPTKYCDQDERAEVGVQVLNPSTIVTIGANPTTVSESGTDVTLTITEQNNGNTDLTDPYVDLQPLALKLEKGSPSYVSGDTDGDGELDHDPAETWTWSVVDLGVNADKTYTAIGHGTDPFGNDVTWCEDPAIPPDNTVCDQDEQAEATVTLQGGGYCTFTQGYWGNEGGTKCGGKTTTQLINEALGDPVVPVVVGVLGERSITFSSAADIILRLPCGGTPRALPEGLNVNAHDTAALKTAKLLKGKDDRITNTLVGQVVALTLNMRLHTIPCMDADGFDQALADYVFPEADYICVQKGEDGCIERHAIPESLQGLSVDALLETANLALAGDEELVGGAYDGASFVNELFDECMTIVTCPDIDEICDNDCDDDFDGLTDLNDPDCAI